MNLNRFKTKKVNTITTVGECLRKKREELGISIQEISKKLKIKLSYLEDLESNNYEELPPDVYLKGFIRNYAQLVGFDPEKMIGLYNREKNIRNKIEKKVVNRNKETKFAAPNYAIVTPKIITIFFGLLILLIIGYYFWYQISSFSSTPYLFVSHPSADQIVDISEITVEGETEKDTTLKINGEEVFVDSNSHFRENIMLKVGKNVLIIEATNRFNKTAREEINVIYEKKLEPVPAYDTQEETHKEVDGAYKGDIEIIGP